VALPVIALLFTLCLPPTLPLWKAALGSGLGFAVGKEIFGGVGRNFLNPPLTGLAFLYFAYPGALSGSSVWLAVDGFSGATPLAVATDAGLAGIEAAGLGWWTAAIGRVPGAEGLGLCPHWQRTMQGHSASNLMAVVASNRFLVKQKAGYEISWFGSSFITDGQGQKIAEAGRESEEVIVAEVNLDLIRILRDGFLFFRDRRPEMYGSLLEMTG